MSAEPSAASRSILAKKRDREDGANTVAEWIAAERGYRWVGIYEVTPSEIVMIECTGSKPPWFPRFPVSRGLCGAPVATKGIVNVGDVRKDARWRRRSGRHVRRSSFVCLRGMERCRDGSTWKMRNWMHLGSRTRNF